MLVITAGIFWGSMGLFVRKLGEYGFSSIQITCLRLTVAALVFAALHIVLERGSLMISLRDLPLFLGLVQSAFYVEIQKSLDPPAAGMGWYE